MKKLAEKVEETRQLAQEVRDLEDIRDELLRAKNELEKRLKTEEQRVESLDLKESAVSHELGEALDRISSLERRLR